MARRSRKTEQETPNEVPAAEASPVGGEPEAPAAEAAEVPGRPRRALAIGVAAAVALVAVVGYGAWRMGERGGGVSPEVAAAVAALDGRLAAIEARVDEVSESANAAQAAADLTARLDAVAGALAALDERLAMVETAPPAVDGDLAARVAAVDERLAAIESAPAPGPEALGGLESRADALAALTGDIDNRVAALEARAEAPAPSAPALALAVGQLHAALRGSGPFRPEFDAVHTLLAGDADAVSALTAIESHAGEGVPTVAVLRARFAGIAGPIVRAAYAPAEGDWLDRTLARLSELVTVRRVGDDVPGDSAEAIVARAEARLAAGDLAAAVMEVERLEEAPAKVAAGWLADGQARLAAQRALATLDGRAVTALGG